MFTIFIVNEKGADLHGQVMTECPMKKDLLKLVSKHHGHCAWVYFPIVFNNYRLNSVVVVIKNNGEILHGEFPKMETQQCRKSQQNNTNADDVVALKHKRQTTMRRCGRMVR